MKKYARDIAKKLYFKLRRGCTHGELIRRLAQEHTRTGSPHVFVETGCGLSTISLAETARASDGKVYSCDVNEEKVEDLRRRAGSALENVNFLIGDSLESLRKVAQQHERITILFLDSAPSAMHTFREFHVVERCLGPGSCVVIDNAALPNAKLLLSPCRKGKIIVPYLLASPHWEVTGHPTAGDSMVSAVCHEEPAYAHPAYERLGFVDPWQKAFAARLD